MGSFIARRLVGTVAVLFAITVLVFVIFFLTPGVDPARRLAGRNPNPETIALIQVPTAQLSAASKAALAHLTSAPIELIIALARSPRDDGLLVACKAAGLNWHTVRGMLADRQAKGRAADPDFTEAKRGYDKLSKASAQRTVRFWQVRVSSAPPAPSARRTS